MAPMAPEARSKVAGGIVAAVIVLGLLSDSLLRATLWGLNAALWLVVLLAGHLPDYSARHLTIFSVWIRLRAQG